MIFIETSLFTKLLPDYLSKEGYRAFQKYLMENPEAGDVIRGGGGVRKVRWAMAGRGKSGGARIIYFWKVSKSEIWFLTIYSKSEKDSIPSHILRKIAEEIKNV
jgi:mRNA-degrading endonuclease RelE of RelBE toxin-antitoxin system